MYESPPWTSSRKIILPPPSLHFFQWLDKHGYGCCFWILKIGEKKCISTLRNCKCDTSEYGMKFWINFINTAIVSLATWLECLNSIRLNKPLDRNSFVFFLIFFPPLHYFPINPPFSPWQQHMNERNSTRTFSTWDHLCIFLLLRYFSSSSFLLICFVYLEKMRTFIDFETYYSSTTTTVLV